MVISMRTLYRWVGGFCGLFFVVLGMHGEDQIRSYNVAKEAPADVPAAADIPVNASPVRFVVPDGWQQLAPDSVRLVNLSITGKNGGAATVVITSFPGEVGTEMQNVNRWRGQVGLPDAAATDITSQPVLVDGSTGKLYDFSGPTGRTIVVSVPRNGATWFIKLNGDAAVVGDAKPGFMDFLASVRFPGAAATGVDTVASVSPEWSVPSNWTKTEPGAMVFRSFSIGDNAGNSAAVTVSFFPGDVGGNLANVNRWRGQMELPEVADLSLNGLTENVDTLGGTGLMVDFEGTGSKSGKRLVAVIVPHGANTWFYKLIGDRALVATQKDGFVNFVKNVHYPAN
jgi:hypothetical protein